MSSYRGYAPQTLSLTKSGVGGVMLGRVHVPVDELGRMMISFRGPSGTFPYYSVADVMTHRVPDADLKGRIVLLGMTAHGLGDRVTTPTGAISRVSRSRPMLSTIFSMATWCADRWSLRVNHGSLQYL